MNENLTYSTISETEFHDLILSKRGIPLLIAFTADWLGEGTMMDAIFENLSTHYHDKAGFYRIDVEESKEISHQLGIRRLPAMFIFKNGEIADHFTGMLPKKTIEERLNKLL